MYKVGEQVSAVPAHTKANDVGTDNASGYSDSLQIGDIPIGAGILFELLIRTLDSLEAISKTML